ncbi:alpha-amylase family glycosyl hydrolase [Neolewinella lacunae]|uniref:Glycosyl hydrolase family 13 catalytic domain-containing protein n=1 Tax=Neolewinella lacunae TaxID=1517758 RepID=A0A923PJD3_9BACT|nr:alpha-amylase family glycosyl hydrolase [Neolewinella lacunae]MBC6993650.1 hypothetical protein [Neolewinella lacunae]MDN3634722.1 alpha-amylase family glycosyl hydrolase [Neolewinella lacunae]
MQKILFLSLLMAGSLSIGAQDFMLQGWFWDYPKDGCFTSSGNYSGPNWASTVNSKVNDLANAGFTYVWLPPLSRASFGACSNGYDPQDLYDLGDPAIGRTGFGTRAEVDALVANLSGAGIQSVADVVYNHRDGGKPEDNPAVKAYIETHFNGMGKQPYPSDRFRCRLPLGGSYGAGDYYFKISSKTQSYGPNEYQFRAYVAGVPRAAAPDINENEPNGGGDCSPQPFNTVQLNQRIRATLFDFSGCYTDEFKLSISAADFLAGGDDLLIDLINANVSERGYSDHRIYAIYYESNPGTQGINIPLEDLKYQTYTDFTTMPSGQGPMNFENFRPNSANTSTTFMAGDFDAPLFFYDVVQENPSTLATYADWTHWLLNDVGMGGLRLDAVKHFPPVFVAQILDELASRNPGSNPPMVVGEFFDGNPTLLAAWVDQVNSNITSSTAYARVFDFTLRNALKEACDNGGYDLRNVFSSSLRDNGLSGFNVVTFINNHDFRGPGEPVQNDLLLAYAYLLTNNQLGVPTVFYPDFFGTSIPNAPVFNLGAEISELMQIHRDHIFGSPTVDYLNRFGTPYFANYQQGSSNRALIYQIIGGAGATDLVVAINFGNSTLKVDQTINATASGGLTQGSIFNDLTGNAFNSSTTLNGSNQILIDVPAKSFAIYAATGASLPVELLSFTAQVDAKGLVQLDWETALEENVADFVPEYSVDGSTFVALNPVNARNTPGKYAYTDNRPWPQAVRYYRLRSRDTDGQEQLSAVRRLTFRANDLLRVSPNPAGDRVRVFGLATEAAWLLTNVAGQRQDLNAHRGDGWLEMDLTHLPAGLYYLRTGGEVVKIVKQ